MQEQKAPFTPDPHLVGEPVKPFWETADPRALAFGAIAFVFATISTGGIFCVGLLGIVTSYTRTTPRSHSDHGYEWAVLVMLFWLFSLPAFFIALPGWRTKKGFVSLFAPILSFLVPNILWAGINEFLTVIGFPTP